MNMLPTQEDKDKFYSYPESEQERVKRLWTAMVEINTASAHTSVRAACRVAATHCEFSMERLQHLFPEWEKAGFAWTTLIDKARFPDEPASRLPDEFLRWVGGQFLGNQRKDRPAWRAVIRRWHGWRGGNEAMRIPGYEECPPPGANGHWPTGWGYSNLQNKVANTKAVKALARVGISAALEHLPSVPQTRVGLKPLEYIFFDDVWVDRKVIVPGHGACRLLQLGCLDYCSGVYLKFGQRPQITGEDGHYQRLKERDMKWLVAMLLEEWGYPADYVMHLICERGTATLRKADAQSLYDLSDGHIQVFYTSMIGEVVQAWDEKKTGNSRGKSPLESWHNLYHNENASLPGQVGKDNEHQPKALLAQENEAELLMSARHFLSAEQQARLSLPFSDWREAYFESQSVIRRINNRTDHGLEGFDRSVMWRINAPGCVTDWKKANDLRDKQGQPVVATDMQKYIQWTSRPEKPSERLLRLSQCTRWNKIPLGIMSRFYEDCHVLVRIKNYGIKFNRDGKTYSYIPDCPERSLPENNEYLVYYRPFDMGTIHITEKQKNGEARYVGTWKLQAGVNRHDMDGKVEAIKTKRSFLNHAMGDVRNKEREFIASEDAKLRVNLAILEDAKLIASPDATPLGNATRVTTEAGAALATAATEQDNEAAKAAAVREVDTAKEELKNDLPIQPTTEEWI